MEIGDEIYRSILDLRKARESYLLRQNEIGFQNKNAFFPVLEVYSSTS